MSDATVMISSMNEIRDQGGAVQVAAASGAARRLRPIISTTLTTLASAIIWELIAATLFAMLTTPALFLPSTRERA